MGHMLIDNRSFQAVLKIMLYMLEEKIDSNFCILLSVRGWPCKKNQEGILRESQAMISCSLFLKVSLFLQPSRLCYAPYIDSGCDFL